MRPSQPDCEIIGVSCFILMVERKQVGMTTFSRPPGASLRHRSTPTVVTWHKLRHMEGSVQDEVCLVLSPFPAPIALRKTLRCGAITRNKQTINHMDQWNTRERLSYRAVSPGFVASSSQPCHRVCVSHKAELWHHRTQMSSVKCS